MTIGDCWPDRRVTTDNCWPDLGRPQNSDANMEGNYNWLSGEPKLYSNWRPGQPSNDENANCVVTRPDGFWNNVACDRGSVNPDGELRPQFDIAHACQQLMCDDGKADTILRLLFCRRGLSALRGPGVCRGRVDMPAECGHRRHRRGQRAGPTRGPRRLRVLLRWWVLDTTVC